MTRSSGNESLRPREADAIEETPLRTESLPRPGPISRLADWLGGVTTPGLAAAVAAVLLITFVLREREPTPPTGETLRASEVQSPIALRSPEASVELSTDVEFSWEPMAGAVRYRVLLVSLESGDVASVGHTQNTTLLASGTDLSERLGPGTHDVHWIVRARLLDGSEISSEPRRLTWTSR